MFPHEGNSDTEGYNGQTRVSVPLDKKIDEEIDEEQKAKEAPYRVKLDKDGEPAAKKE